MVDGEGMPTEREWLEGLRERAGVEPLDVDVADYGDEWVRGFLAGQQNAIDYIRRDAEGRRYNAEVAQGQYEASREQYR